MSLQQSAAPSFPPAELLMICDVFEHTAEVKKRKRKTEEQQKGLGQQSIMQARMDSWGR